MSFSTTSSLHYGLRGTPNATSPFHQTLKVRLGYCSRLVSRSPSAGISDQILQQTPSTLMGEALFPFPLSVWDAEVEQQLEFGVIEFLCSFNLHPSACDIIFHRIVSFAQHFAAGDTNRSFEIEADIDYMKEFWMDAIPGLYPVPITQIQGQSVGEEDEIEEAPPAATRGAPEWVIERVRRQKFDGFGAEEETEERSVCYEDLNRGKEVSRIPCGHVYHKSCILTWLHRSNSCPLCRRPLHYN